MGLLPNRRIEHDWYDGPVPDGVTAHDDTHLASAFCFANAEGSVQIARGAHIYAGSLFDVGPHGRVTVGECAMLNGVYVVCDASVDIGAFATISWNVVFMDNYRMPVSPAARREVLRQRVRERAPQPKAAVETRPVLLRDNVWIGFDVCVLPGVTIGEGSVVGARSVVVESVPDYTVVAGNPARVIRSLPRPAGPLERP
jgi:acetyltransferase-like isoleucine patch superfamily enzyme